MVTTTTAYRNAIDTGTRGQWSATVSIGGKEFTGSDIKSIKLEESELESSKLSIGCVVSSTLTVKLKNDDSVKYSNGTLTFSISLTTADGKTQTFHFQDFYVTDVEVDSEREYVELTALDGIKKTSIPYITALTYPASFESVAKEYARKCGLEFDASMTWEDITIDAEIEASTVREAFQVLGQLIGKNLIINRDNKLEFRYFTNSGLTIGASKTYTGATVGDMPSYVYSVSMSDGEENTYLARGTSKGEKYNALKIEIENAYATQAIADSVLKAIEIEYDSASFSFIGDPSICVGDIITFTDSKGNSHNVPIMKNTLEYDGGVKNTVESWVETEEAQEMTATKKKNDTINKSEILAEALKDAKEMLNEWSEAGNVQYGQHEIIIGDSDTIDTSQNLWRWNLGGLMHYSHGIDGPVDDAGVAITMDGHINGNYITANTISAEAISKTYKDGVSSEIKSAADDAEEASNSATDEKLENYSTTSEVTSAISNANNQVLLDVSGTYETKENVSSKISDAKTDINNTTDTKLKNYYTQKEVDSKISVSETGITQSVSDTLKNYYTSETVDNKLSGYTTSSELNSKLDGYATDDDVVEVVERVATLETTASSIKASVEKVEENTKVNLIENGNFVEKVTDYWIGSKISQMVTTLNTSALWMTKSESVKQIIDIQKDGTYTLTFKYVGATSLSLTVRIRKISSNDTLESTLYSGTATGKGGSSFATYTGSVKLTAGSRISVEFSRSSTSGNMYITDVQLVGLVGSGKSASSVGILSDSITSYVSSINSSMEEMQSSIEQNAESITLKVSKNGVVSSINQSSESIKINASKLNITSSAVKVAFNGTSQYVQLSTFTDNGVTKAGIDIKTSAKKLKLRLRDDGMRCYYNSKLVGLIGTQRYNSTSNYSLEFKLLSSGNYMTWCHDNGSSVSMVWTYAKKSVAGYKKNTLNAGCDINLNGKNIYGGVVTPWWTKYNGTKYSVYNGKIRYISKIEPYGNGGTQWWTSEFLVRNGLIVSA